MKKLFYGLLCILVFLGGCGNSVRKENIRQSEEYVEKGISKSQDLKGGINDFNKAIELNPENNKAYLARAMANAGLGNFTGAKQDIDKAIELDDSNILNYQIRGTIKKGLKDNEGALNDFNTFFEKTSITDQEMLGSAYQQRGITKLNLKDYKGALDDFNQAISMRKVDFKSHFFRGAVKGLLGDTQGATDDYQKAYNINPQMYNDYENKIAKGIEIL